MQALIGSEHVLTHAREIRASGHSGLPVSRLLAQPHDGCQTCVTQDLVVRFCYTDEKG